MATQTDLAVALEDRPGMAARVGEALGRAGINIDGVCALISAGVGLFHVLIANDHMLEAQKAIVGEGLEVSSVQEVWVAQCPDRPGELGRVLRRLAASDVNVELLYLTTTGRLVIGAEDLDRVGALLS